MGVRSSRAVRLRPARSLPNAIHERCRGWWPRRRKPRRNKSQRAVTSGGKPPAAPSTSRWSPPASRRRRTWPLPIGLPQASAHDQGLDRPNWCPAAVVFPNAHWLRCVVHFRRNGHRAAAGPGPRDRRGSRGTEDRRDADLPCLLEPALSTDSIRANNSLERVIHDIRRSTRVASASPDGNLAVIARSGCKDRLRRRSCAPRRPSRW
jgi:hypothetical protein